MGNQKSAVCQQEAGIGSLFEAWKANKAGSNMKYINFDGCSSSGDTGKVYVYSGYRVEEDH